MTLPLKEVCGYEELQEKAREFEDRFDKLLEEYQIEVTPPLLKFNDETKQEERNPYAMHISSMGECPANVRGDIAAQVVKELRRRAANLLEAAKAVESKLK